MHHELQHTVNEIDALIRRELWFDFHIYRYEKDKLIVAGGIDLVYYHTLEIIFENVYFIKGYFNGWKSDTTRPVFSIADENSPLNTRYEIEEGFHTFIFKAEDCENDIIIAAGKISFNTDTVFYYKREDLKENERIAYFVPLQ